MLFKVREYRLKLVGTFTWAMQINNEARRGGTDRQTDRQTHKNDYRNPPAHAPRVNEVGGTHTVTRTHAHT